MRELHAFSAAPYIPTTSHTGNGVPAILRGKNLMLRGSAPDKFYYEVYAGSYDLSETISDSALTGTVSLTANSRTVTGSGTSFTTELHLGQFLFVNGELVVVDRIDSTTSFQAAEGAQANVSGATAYRCPVLFELDKKRASLLRGNVLKFDKGTLIGVGAGTLKVNGADVPGTAFTVSKTPKIGIFNGSTYTAAYALGGTAPSAPTIAATTGGTKGMVAGEYGIAIAKARANTTGYCELSPMSPVTIADGGMVEITLPAMDTANGFDAWVIFATLFNATAAANGTRVMYFAKKLTTADVSSGGGTYNLEYIDAEIGGNEIASYNNFPPPECEFVQTLAGTPIYLSCYGDLSGSAQAGKSPGPRIVPSKPRNVDAALIDVSISTSPPETIISAIPGPARIYAGTPSSLNIVQLSGRDDVPITVRQFWRTGVKNPYAVTFVNDRLIGFATSGPTRSGYDGEAGSEEHSFADAVIDITSAWTPGKVLTVHDPKNNVVCLVHPANHKNESGYWVSVVQMFNLRFEAWSIPVYIESTTGDRIITGLAKVEEKMYFIAGGTQSGGSRSWKTYEFDRVSGESVPYYAAWHFSDEGSGNLEEEIEYVTLTAKLTSGNMQVYTLQQGDDVDIAAIEAGTGSASGNISFSNTTAVTRYPLVEVNLPESSMYAVRVSGTWAGSGTKDRIDKVALLPTTVAGER